MLKPIVLLCLLPSLTAHAQAGNVFSAAYYVSGERAFDAANALHAAGRDDLAADTYVQALRAFEVAYQSFPSAEIAFGIALCYWRIDAPFMAQLWLKRYYHSLRRSEHPSLDAERLTTMVIAAIDSFEDDIHYDFRCDEKKRVCLSSTNWPDAGVVRVNPGVAGAQ